MTGPKEIMRLMMMLSFYAGQVGPSAELKMYELEHFNWKSGLKGGPISSLNEWGFRCTCLRNEGWDPINGYLMMV